MMKKNRIISYSILGFAFVVSAISVPTILMLNSHKSEEEIKLNLPKDNIDLFVDSTQNIMIQNFDDLEDVSVQIKNPLDAQKISFNFDDEFGEIEIKTLKEGDATLSINSSNAFNAKVIQINIITNASGIELTKNKIEISGSHGKGEAYIVNYRDLKEIWVTSLDPRVIDVWYNDAGLIDIVPIKYGDALIKIEAKNNRNELLVSYIKVVIFE